jgi:hypothetical protein
MGKTALLISLLFALLSASARADSWVRPEPTSFHSRGFGYVAEIFPAHSRQNSGDKPLCYFYELGYPGSDWRIDARLKWKAPLVNERMPYQALISQAGDLITLNEHGSVGYRNAIVIYDQLGRATKAYELDDLLPADEISMNENTNKIPISTSFAMVESRREVLFLSGAVTILRRPTLGHRARIACEGRNLSLWRSG